MNKNLQVSTPNALVAGAMGSVESNRAIAEVQGQVLMAKQFPRDQIQARANIIEACKRPRLAETAIYSYPRGGSRVEGPSVRLAEMLAQYWGNIDFGIVELEQKKGESVMMSYCRDIQTNTRRQMVFNVPHVRYTRAKGNTELTDPRDIYEMVANMGARRLRACILAIIPGDIIEEAIEQCNKTLAGASDEPLIDRIKKMVAAFVNIGVSQAMLEKRLGHKMDASLPTEIVQLRKIYKSLQDGMSKPDDWFKSEIQDITPPAPKKETTPPPPQNEVGQESAVDRLREMYDPENEEYSPVFQRLFDEKTLDPMTVASVLDNNLEDNAPDIITLIENSK
jgi:hypothetical protein